MQGSYPPCACARRAQHGTVPPPVERHRRAAHHGVTIETGDQEQTRQTYQVRAARTGYAQIVRADQAKEGRH
jgi:hypothetical protein